MMAQGFLLLGLTEHRQVDMEMEGVRFTCPWAESVGPALDKTADFQKSSYALPSFLWCVLEQLTSLG